MDLLHCPFCGGPARMFPPKPNHVGHRVSCLAVMTCGHRGAARLTEQDAAEAWNRRADHPEGAGVAAPLSWRCFHCDFNTTDRAAAAEHFGTLLNEREPLCIRRVEAVLPRLQAMVGAQSNRGNHTNSEVLMEASALLRRLLREGSEPKATTEGRGAEPAEPGRLADAPNDCGHESCDCRSYCKKAQHKTAGKL